jgi:AcrR family transcriptional regulator
MKAPVSRDPQVVVGRILDAAQAEFQAVGFEAASTNAITQAFGGSKATLFRHFPTKQQLLEAVIRRVAGRWQSEIGQTGSQADAPADWLEDFAIRTLTWILSPDLLFVGRLAIAEGHKFPELQSVFRETAGGPLQARLVERLTSWTQSRILDARDPERDAVHFLDLVAAGAVSRALYGDGVLSAEAQADHARRAVALFLDGRRPR